MPLVQEFVKLSFGAILLFLLLAHFTGAEGIANAVGGQTANIYKTLQGR